MLKKDDKKKTAEEMNTLFRPVEQKVTRGDICEMCDSLFAVI